MLLGTVAPAAGRHGLGLRATAPVPAGTVVWLPCPHCPRWGPGDRALLPPDVDARLDTWGHLVADGSLLVPCAGAHLMNHSCRAAVLDLGLDFGVAVVDLPAGAEVTCDYGAFSADAGWSMACRCGSDRCRGRVGTADAGSAGIREQWRRRLDEVLAAVPEVEQPLGALLEAISPTYRRLLAGARSVAAADVGHSVVRPGFLY